MSVNLKERMTLGQTDRFRDRQTNRRREPNPLTRSYDSRGPDIRIRGTALHVAERYLQLARDANTASNPVAAENYLQHAEHYFRLMAAAQAEQLQARMLASGDEPAVADVERFCARARGLFRTIISTGDHR